MCEHGRDETARSGESARSIAYPTLGIDVDARFAGIV